MWRRWRFWRCAVTGKPCLVLRCNVLGGFLRTQLVQSEHFNWLVFLNWKCNVVQSRSDARDNCTTSKTGRRISDCEIWDKSGFYYTGVSEIGFLYRQTFNIRLLSSGPKYKSQGQVFITTHRLVFIAKKPVVVKGVSTYGLVRTFFKWGYSMVRCIIMTLLFVAFDFCRTCRSFWYPTRILISLC